MLAPATARRARGKPWSNRWEFLGLRSRLAVLRVTWRGLPGSGAEMCVRAKVDHGATRTRVRARSGRRATRATGGECRARRDGRGGPRGREPRPRAPRRGRCREVRAARSHGAHGDEHEHPARRRRGIRNGVGVRRTASAVRAAARSACRICPSRSARRWRRRSGSGRVPRPIASSWGSAVLSLLSDVSGNARCCAWSMTRSGWIGPQRRCWASSGAGCWWSRSPSCSAPGSPAVSCSVCRNSRSPGYRSPMLVRCWTRPPRPGSIERIRDRIVVETRGNPLALLELPRGLTATQMAGGLGLLQSGTLPGHIEQSFLTRIDALSAESRLLAAGGGGRAGRRPRPGVACGGAAGVTLAAALATGTDGLLSVDTHMTFRHPLVRSAVYQAASGRSGERCTRRLRRSPTQQVDPDRRAWHLAAAARGARRGRRRGARAVRRSGRGPRWGRGGGRLLAAFG